jgi:hypothetical protein
MKEDRLNELFRRAREARRDESTPGWSHPQSRLQPRPGFATTVVSRHLAQVRESRFATRTSVISICTALLVLATLTGVNFNALTVDNHDAVDPIAGIADALWDSVGN